MTEIKIDESKVKAKLLNILVKLTDFYIKLNQQLFFFWVNVADKQNDSRWTFALKTLINNPATLLFLNTVLLAAIGIIFGGTIQMILYYVAGLNIIVFCSKILSWEDKLKK